MKLAYFLNLSLFVLFVLSACEEPQLPTVKAVDRSKKIRRIRLKPDFQVENSKLNESSGLVKSHRFPDVYWSHNDSGDKPRIFAINKEGKTVTDSLNPSNSGIFLTSAKNNDWEDIAILEGDLIISDMGNNKNSRKNLGLFRIPEPIPYGTKKIEKAIHYPVKYPDQIWYPAPWRRNFDCEAIFGFKGKIYLLTKHRSDLFTKLYRFNDLKEGEENIPELLDRFDIDGKVTSASISKDQKQLAVLTYTNVWVFSGFESDDFFDHEIYFYRLNAKQCEAVEFLSEDKLLITNEEGGIYILSIDDFHKMDLI